MNISFPKKSDVIPDKSYHIHFFGVMGNDGDGEGGFFGHHVQNLTFEEINSAILPLMC
jgi:hypothetical protein